MLVKLEHWINPKIVVVATNERNGTESEKMVIQTTAVSKRMVSVWEDLLPKLQ